MEASRVQRKEEDEEDGKEGGRGLGGQRGQHRAGYVRRPFGGGKREGALCTKRGGKDAGAQDAGRRCSTTLHWQLYPSHTRYEPCSRATLHRDTRRTIVASAPTGGTSSSSIFVPVDVHVQCASSSNATGAHGGASIYRLTGRPSARPAARNRALLHVHVVCLSLRVQRRPRRVPLASCAAACKRNPAAFLPVRHTVASNLPLDPHVVVHVDAVRCVARLYSRDIRVIFYCVYIRTVRKLRSLFSFFFFVSSSPV